jgi:hypothetical protein
VMCQLPHFQTINDQIVLPPEYLDALHWNLARRLCVVYGVPIPPELTGYAEASMRAIEEVNSQIPLLHMPVALRGKSGAYNIYGDFYVGSAG